MKWTLFGGGGGELHKPWWLWLFTWGCLVAFLHPRVAYTCFKHMQESPGSLWAQVFFSPPWYQHSKHWKGERKTWWQWDILCFLWEIVSSVPCLLISSDLVLTAMIVLLVGFWLEDLRSLRKHSKCIWPSQCALFWINISTPLRSVLEQLC